MAHSLANRIARAMTVDFLMTTAPMLARASSAEEALALHREFDVVPHPKNGKISGYFLKGAPAIHQLSTNVIISGDTAILDLPGLFARQPFFFVLRGSRIEGYIHYSDLNKPPARVPFFALLELAERVLADLLNSIEIPDEKVKGHAAMPTSIAASDENWRRGWQTTFIWDGLPSSI